MCDYGAGPTGSRLKPACLLVTLLLSGCGSGPAIREPLTFAGNLALQADSGSVPAVDLLEQDSGASRLYVPHTSRGALEVFEQPHWTVPARYREPVRDQGDGIVLDGIGRIVHRDSLEHFTGGDVDPAFAGDE